MKKGKTKRGCEMREKVGEERRKEINERERGGERVRGEERTANR